MSLSIKTLSTLVLTPDESFQHLLMMLLREIGITKVLPNNNFEEAIYAYKQGQPDICIVDTSQFPEGKSGVNFASYIQKMNRHVPFVFLVASFNDASHEQVQAFDQSSILSREVSKLKLLQAIKYSLLQLENSQLIRQISERYFLSVQSGDIASVTKNKKKLFFKIGDSFRAIEKKKISFFFAESKLTYARVGKRNFPTNVQLKTLESELSPSFVRCHKKYILNVSHIESIFLKKGKVKINDELLPIGYSYRKFFLEGLNLLK